MPLCHPDQGRDGFESRSLRKAGIRKASSKEGAFVFQEVLKRLLLVIRLKSSRDCIKIFKVPLDHLDLIGNSLYE